MMSRRWLRRLRWPCVALLIGGLLYVGRGALLPWAGAFLDVSEPPPRVDCVLVLGGGNNTRPFVAAAMVNAGRARSVLVPGVRLGADVVAGLVPSEDEIIRRVLLARGVPESAIVALPGVAASTSDEAHALRRYLEEHGQRSVAVVTNDYHTRRARMLFARALGERAANVHFVAAPTDDFDATNWWRTEAGFRLYLTEYVKLTYRWLGLGERPGRP